MSGVFNVFGVSVIAVSFLAMSSVAQAASGRGAYSNVRSTTIGQSSSGTAASGRMPTMPTLPQNSWGSMVNDLNKQPSTWQPSVPDTPGQPDVPDTPDEPDVPDEPDKPDVPDQPDNPVLPSECPDGGVKNSDYTIDTCMDDILYCVNTGALPGGITDMYDSDTRNAIINGMGLCMSQVEKCVAQVRRDCTNVYNSVTDVWIDFNLRKVQPEYYNLVLRKTGLTPVQAEATCRYLDGNIKEQKQVVHVDSSTVTTESSVPTKKSYIKAEPLTNKVAVTDGVAVSQKLASGQYARWDAKTATCYVRVAAYNRDTPIKNSWLFGAAGDDKLAEVWRAAGDSFTCNKDLFGFSLMNDTHTVAVVGIGGGTLVGAGVGAIAGHGSREFNCADESSRKKLAEELVKHSSTLSQYKLLEGIDFENLDVAGCEKVSNFYQQRYKSVADQVKVCDGLPAEYVKEERKYTIVVDGAECTVTVPDSTPNDKLKELVEEACADYIGDDEDVGVFLNALKEKMSKNTCYFIFSPKSENWGDGCTAGQDGCESHDFIEGQVEDLAFLDKTVLAGIKSNMLKSVGIGAAVGAGTGGLATAITAMVEKNNITCRVGDNLESVGLGKSLFIDSLRDFYVKFDLNLPETSAPTSVY